MRMVGADTSSMAALLALLILSTQLNIWWLALTARLAGPADVSAGAATVKILLRRTSWLFGACHPLNQGTCADLRTGSRDRVYAMHARVFIQAILGVHLHCGRPSAWRHQHACPRAVHFVRSGVYRR